MSNSFEKLKTAWGRALDLPVIRTIANRDLRYITLHGDPLDEPLRKAFLRSVEFKTAILPLAAAISYAVIHRDYNAAATYAFSGFSGIALPRSSKEISRNIMPYVYDNFCVDKKGHLRRVTGNEYQDSSFAPKMVELSKQKIIKNSMLMVVMGQLMHLASTFAFHTKDSTDMRLMALLIFLPGIADEISTFNRFKNVQNGKWAIVKTPPKEEVRQEQERKVPDAVPDLV